MHCLNSSSYGAHVEHSPESVPHFDSMHFGYENCIAVAHVVLWFEGLEKSFRTF